MRFHNAVIPLRAAWSSPFVRWQGETADVNSLEFACQVTERALRERAIEWPISELVLGWTIPQKEAFYGAPTLAAQLGAGLVRAGPDGADGGDLITRRSEEMNVDACLCT